MFNYTAYSPYICIGVILLIIFFLWVFWGNKDDVKEEVTTDDTINMDYVEFEDSVCLGPLGSSNQSESVYENQMNITPAVETGLATDSDFVCKNESHQSDMVSNIKHEDNNKIKNNKNRKRLPSKGERICCETMERIYGVKFTSVYPDWLRNPETGRKLELDCYNDDLKLAVEYNGEQHYNWPKYPNQTYDEFINQVRRDKLKADLCDQHGVYLIVVPYTVKHQDIPAFIAAHLPETIQKRIYDENTLSDILD